MTEKPANRKEYPVLGCCGIDCGLCPRFYTEGSSKCPGCGGDGFESKHPPCSVKTCCMGKRGLEVCSQCEDYPCSKYADRAKLERDSFVTHKRIFENHDQIRACGVERFIAGQSERVSVLQELLAKFDDGRSKSFYCLAAALLPVDCLKAAIIEAATEDDGKKKSKALKAALQKHAEIEGVTLSLTK